MVYINDYTPLMSIINYYPFSDIFGFLCLFSVVFVPTYIIYYARKYNH
ncbi:hypothetical protein [uncultured Methanobrevibacter sp.]|nr:hypothetical protein [uncultured Methanobrevibacter sp.]